VRISKIRINNFANFSEFEIETGDNLVVVGENKVGKSNLIFALQLILDPGLRGLARFQSAGSARAASAEGERPRRVNRFSSGAPERLRCNPACRHRAGRRVSNDNRDRASRGNDK
jgi:predicted ATP-dependent endonuclease of OLD family